MSKPLICPVCTHAAITCRPDNVGHGAHYLCANCLTRFTPQVVRRYMMKEYNTSKEHKVLNEEVTKEMREEHFEATGIYATDAEIYTWFN